jgi:hypothetical protein
MPWEYKTIYYDPDDDALSDHPLELQSAEEFVRELSLIIAHHPGELESDLNTLGREGWELVTVVPGKASQDGRPWVAIFKRSN